MGAGRCDPGACLIAVQGWRERWLRERTEVRYCRACLRRGDRAVEARGRRKIGHPSECSAGYDDLLARRRRVEGGASARRPHNHASACRVGDTGVELPLGRTSENAVKANFAEEPQGEVRRTPVRRSRGATLAAWSVCDASIGWFCRWGSLWSSCSYSWSIWRYSWLGSGLASGLGSRPEPSTRIARARIRAWNAC
jgi:hypothetical protein